MDLRFIILMMTGKWDFGIAHRLLAVTADYASNNSTMMAHGKILPRTLSRSRLQCCLESSGMYGACFKSWALNKFWKNLNSPLKRTHMKVALIQVTKWLQRSLDFHLVPIIHVVNCWNSTYDVLVRAVEITFFRYKDRDLIYLVLTEADWNCISQLIEVLAPLKKLLCWPLKMANR